MLRSVREFLGYHSVAVDGKIGHVHDAYFEDRSWALRYLVIDTGSWLPGRRVLIACDSVGSIDWSTRTVNLLLGREAVRTSPPIDFDKPISAQQEFDLRAHFELPHYASSAGISEAPWVGSAGSGRGAPSSARVGSTAQSGRATSSAAGAVGPEQAGSRGQLRSARHVMGHHIEAVDGEIGHVEDFIMDDEDWVIRYFVVNTRNWLPGKKVLAALDWIRDIDWENQKVVVEVSREAIRQGPEFDPAAPVNREYEARLYDYYGRPRYWD